MPLKLHQEEAAPINLTSMIDVLFLLIIFFMVGTRFSENEGTIEVNLPKVANGGAMLNTPNAKVVSLRSDLSLTLDSQPMSLLSLEQTLARERANFPGLVVQFKADGKCEYQAISEAMSAIKRAGITNLQIRTAEYQMPSGTRR
jgi:biopolymer transport protein ExbD